MSQRKSFVLTKAPGGFGIVPGGAKTPADASSKGRGLYIKGVKPGTPAAAEGTATSTYHFGPFPTQFQARQHPTRAVHCALLGARAYRVLIRACNTIRCYDRFTSLGVHLGWQLVEADGHDLRDAVLGRKVKEIFGAAGTTCAITLELNAALYRQYEGKAVPAVAGAAAGEA